MKKLFVVAALTAVCADAALANGGAWQAGIPGTGTGSASDKGQSTNVTIESERLKIDLHAEFAAVEVHYRMHNTGAKVLQDFFFPVERWDVQDGEEPIQPADLEGYQIRVDGNELRWTNVPGPTNEKTQVRSGGIWEQGVPVIKSWKKSVIPFERGQSRDIAIGYRARYSENNESVSDDVHVSDALFAYSLSPAATWKGPIGKGTIEIDILHPEPEDVSIEQPKDRFRKTSATRYEWSFENLKPSLADDIRIVAHSKYDSYATGYSEEERARNASYVLRGHHYFLDHADYDATASSTLAPEGKRHYEVENIKGTSEEIVPWAEGVKGNGIGESISLDVRRPLPLYGILILPGYWTPDSRPRNEDAWWKNNRVAALEITLNGEHTFGARIPNEAFHEPYLIRVADYTKPVIKIKLVIKEIYPGSKFQDTCISLIKLRAALAKKPEVHPAR